MIDLPLMMECPKCGVEQEDWDGFGVLYCPTCGFCTHSSITGGVCDLCERNEEQINNQESK